MRPPRVLVLIFAASATLLLISRSVAYVRAASSYNPAFASSGSQAPAKPGASTGGKSVLSFMYYNTPFSLFPPNAAISLTDDNSTSFAARPAAFGPNLASRGLSGQLWVGSGFAEDHFSMVGELGCSDIPGWGEVVRVPSINKMATSASQHERDQGGDKADDASLTHPIARRSAPPPTDQDFFDAEVDEIRGKIVLLTRGGCGFLDKVMWAQRRGAVAVVVGDNQKGGPLIQMFAHGPEVDNVTIPSVFTARTTAQLLSSLAQPGSFIEDTTDNHGKPILKVHQRPSTRPRGPPGSRAFPDDKRASAASSFSRRLSSLFDRKRSPKSNFAWGKRVRSIASTRKLSEVRENEEVAERRAYFTKLFEADRDNEQDTEVDTVKEIEESMEGNPKDAYYSDDQISKPGGGDDDQPDVHEGLWVTITPTSSASPFFDTLLVLVISPLMTLTVVYGMLILRARIRRRRWRAPKSVVEQLPVRTYHTVATSSPSLSPRLPSPTSSSPATPLLQESPAPTPTRSRTSTGFVENDGLLSPSSAIPALAAASRRTSRPEREKGTSGFSTEWKKYMGRQVECVVCLEEYVDGVSQVMSLPCGHEFHAECITPWLTTRRRTCPICKGDVVRSLAHGSSSEPHYEPYHDDDSDVESVMSPIAEASGSGQDEPEPDLEQGLMSTEPRTSRGWTRQDGWLGIFTNGFGNRVRSPSPDGQGRG